MSDSTIRAGLIVFGVYTVGQSLYMLAAPGSFFDTLGSWAPQNDHYIRDNATFALALGVAVLIAIPERGWRVPVLFLATLWYAAHAVNHLVDIGEAKSDGAGIFAFIALTAATLLLGYLTREAANREEPA